MLYKEGYVYHIKDEYFEKVKKAAEAKKTSGKKEGKKEPKKEEKHTGRFLFGKKS